MKVVVQCSRTSGVDYHRLVRPFELLAREGLEVIFIDDEVKRKRLILEIAGKEDFGILKDCTHMVGSRFWRYPKIEGISFFVFQMRERGIKLILDNDDDWVVPDWNPAHYRYHVIGITNAITHSIKTADQVWVTQARLAEHTKQLNANVHVVPNGIDTGEAQWKDHDYPTEEMRFGYIAGHSHYRDLQWSGIDLSNVEGYTLNHKGYKFSEEEIAEQLAKADTPEKKQHVILNIKLMQNLSKGKSFAETINAKHLLDFKPVTEFADLYRSIDVSLIPLRPSQFNSMKSNLKLLEAGFTKKAAIVSNVFPYTQGLQPGKMCIAVGGSKFRSQDWNKHINGLTHDRATDLAEALHEWVQPYELSRVNEIRKDLLNW